MFEQMMQGLLGGAQTGEDGQPVYDPRVMKQAESYGLPPEMIQQAEQQRRGAVFSNLGATLLGAAQAGPVGQRGKILSQLDVTGGDATKSLMNSAQLRLYADTLKEKQQRRQAAAAFAEQLKSGTLPGLTPEAQQRLMTLGPQKAQEVYTASIGAEFKRPEWSDPFNGPDGKQYIRNLQTNEMKSPGGGGVTVTNQAESEKQKLLGKAEAENELELTNAEKTAYKKQSQLQTLSTMLDTIGKDQGKFFEMKSGLSEALRGFGVGDDAIKRIVGMDPKIAGMGQAVQKMASEALMGKIGSEFPAQNFSNADLEFLKQSYVQLANHPDANRIILEIERRKANADIEAGADYRAWRRANKEGSVADWRDDYRKRLNDPEKGINRFKDINDEIRKIGSPNALPPPAPGAVLSPTDTAVTPTVTAAPGPAADPRDTALPTPMRGQPAQVQQMLSQARAAIAAGADRGAVMKRLRDQGVTLGEM